MNALQLMEIPSPEPCKTEEEKTSLSRVVVASRYSLSSLENKTLHCNIMKIDINKDNKAITDRVEINEEISSLQEMDLDWVLKYIRTIRRNKDIPQEVKDKVLDYIYSLCDF